MTVFELHTFRVGLSGFWGLLGIELRSWLGRRGLIQAMLWTAVVNGLVYLSVATENSPFGRIGYENLLNVLMFVAVFAGIVLTEAMILGEYNSGIAGWLVSKPLARSSYLVAKLLGLWAGLSITAILIPGLVANWWLPKVEPFRFVIPDQPPFGRFLATLFVAIVVMGFFIALTGLLSVVLRRRGVASLIAIIVWAILRIPLPQIPDTWHRYLPSGLITPGTNAADWLPSLEYVHWHAFDPVSAIGSSLLATFVVIVLAALAYQRLEL
jgi:ABC-type transport system involved in multi-copper enzyme maturation permease subunit